MARQVLDHGVIIPAEYSDDWYEDMSTNLNKLNEVIGSDEDKLSEADVSNVALSGDYDDLTDKPSYGVLRITSETLSDSGSGAISNLNSDSKLAAGDYVLDAALKVFPITAVSAPNYTVGTSLFQITNASALAAVATSGSYDDLNNLPAYGITRFVNAAISDNSNVAFANISSVDKIKAGDFLLDNAGKMYLIASVDSVNETAAVTTPLTVLALDSGVMHLSGNETAAGAKTFSSNLTSPGLISISSAETSGQGSSILSLYSTLSFLNGDPSITARLNFRILGSDGSKSLYPHETGQYVLGLTSRRYANTWTNAINALNPGSLSFPDLNNGIDISGFITNLSKGVNTYTPPSNGWLSIRVKKTSLTHVSLMMYQPGGLLSSCETTEFGISGTNLPVIANQNVEIYIIADSLASAKFFPCQGNV